MQGFRVWSNYWKKYAIEAELYMDGSVDAVFEDDSGVPHHENTDIVIEFKTGLKDKNGKEIYGGDIIHKSPYFKKKGNKRFVAQEPYRNPLSVVEWDDDSGAFHENEYEDGEFQIGGFLFEATGEWESLKGTEKNVIEVVGNIHENPELLEEGK